MIVSILQPTYWARCHVWNRVLNSDVFVWLDSVKFSRSSTKWEDRTIIEGSDRRPITLRLPLCGSRNVLWKDAGLNESWVGHRVTIGQAYSRAPYWPSVRALVDGIYQTPASTIDEVCWRSFLSTTSVLNPQCRVVRGSDLKANSAKGELILDMVREVGGTAYIAGGPGATYLPGDLFASKGVKILVQDWKAPVTRGGLANPSVVHLLAHAGPEETRRLLADPDFWTG